jgi:hypothetical protein
MDSIICEKCGEETDVSEEGAQLIMVVCSCGHRIKGPKYPKFKRFQPHKAELNADEINMVLALNRVVPKDVSEFMNLEFGSKYGNFIRKLSRGSRGYD